MSDSYMALVAEAAGSQPAAAPELQPAPVAPADGGAPAATDPNAPAAPAAAAPAPEPTDPNDKRSPQYRFSELTRQRNEQQAEAAYWRGRAEALAASQAAPAAQPTAAAAPQPPNPETYPHKQFDPDYIRDKTKFEVLQEFETRQANLDRQRVEQAQNQAGLQRFTTVFEDIERRGEEFAPALNVLAQVDRPTKDIIASSDNPAYVAAYLAANPQVLSNVSRLHPVDRAMVVGRIDAQIGVALRQASAPPANRDATPTPTPTPRAPGNGPALSGAFDPSTATPAEYRAQRAAGWGAKA